MPEVRARSMVYSLACTLALSHSLICEVTPAPERPLPIAAELFELLAAEDLATITIDRTVHFSTPDGGDAIVTPGVYRILLDEQSGLRFILIKSDKAKVAFLVQALKTNHRDSIPAPVAVYIPDEENIPHIVLLLPGGNSLEAIGSFSGVRARGSTSPLLSLEQVHNAVIEKLRKARNAIPE